MITDQCISVTDLKKDMNATLKNLKKDKFIFVNNAPVAVLMDVKKYEQIMKESNILNYENGSKTRKVIRK